MILPVTDYNIKNNQYFTAKAKKFRLPVQSYIYTIDGIPILSRRCNAVREYSNPNAEELYKKAKKAKDLKEQARLYQEMGHYELVDMDLRERIFSFLKAMLP